MSFKGGCPVAGKKNGREDKYKNVLEILFECNYEVVYKAAYFVTFDEELAKDATQEAFLRAFMRIDSIDDKEKFTSWVCKIARNVSYDILRERVKNKGKVTYIYNKDEEIIEPLLHDGDNDVEKVYINNLIKKEFLKSFNELDPLSRQVLYMKYCMQMTYPEISAELDVNENTLKSIVFRARDMLLYKLKRFK